MTVFCQAVEFDGHVVCPRCGQSWPGTVWSERPPCRAEALEYSAQDMIGAVTTAADTIIGSQVALVKAGDRAVPYEPAMHQASLLLAAARLIERCVGDERVKNLIREGKP